MRRRTSSPSRTRNRTGRFSGSNGRGCRCSKRTAGFGNPSYRQPIDRFLAAKQRELGLTPVGEAPRNILLRRVYLDLIGLPPTRDELHAFLADERPDAYERVVDRLLASPQYGERWGRHWMDVWRYSDWYGRRSVPDVMNSYPHDLAVARLDRPLAERGQGLRPDGAVEMLAADELWPDDQERCAATGFIVRNWFKWNYDTWMRDQVEHTGKAFLGLTFNCALCHDHKYDPITQEDYFRFRAFFEPLELRHDRVAGQADPGPFMKYVYAKSYGPIAHGMIRVFDEKLDAPDVHVPRRRRAELKIEGKPAVPPGVPAMLGGERIAVAADRPAAGGVVSGPAAVRAAGRTGRSGGRTSTAAEAAPVGSDGRESAADPHGAAKLAVREGGADAASRRELQRDNARYGATADADASARSLPPKREARSEGTRQRRQKSPLPSWLPRKPMRCRR